jgi:hypothetical protein
MKSKQNLLCLRNVFAQRSIWYKARRTFCWNWAPKQPWRTPTQLWACSLRASWYEMLNHTTFRL